MSRFRGMLFGMGNDSDSTGTAGTRAVFSVTLGVIALGLALMLLPPLLGR